MSWELLGYAGAVLMGLSLGLLGGGGSILTVPILVYLFGQDPVTATGLSLFIVGTTSAAGLFSHHKQGNIEWRTAGVFGAASILSVFITRRWLVPALPDPLIHVGAVEVGKGTAILGLFAIVMLISAWSMIRGRKSITPGSNGKRHLPSLLPVSYTHLRPHETVLDLVCRLLLEKTTTSRLYASHLHGYTSTS